MKKRIFAFLNNLSKYFDPSIDLRVQTFTLLTFAGMAVSLLTALVSFVTGVAVNGWIGLGLFALSCALLRLSRVSGRFLFCCRVSVPVIFMGAFPVMFFTAGGYHSAMPSYFIFGLIFTALLLDGWERKGAIAAEFFLYVGACLVAYFRPGTVAPLATEAEAAIDIVTGMIFSGALLLSVILLYIRLYRTQQRRLDEQNAVLKQGSRMKTEFLANASHEMRTPLTVASVNVQTVMEILEDLNEDGAADPEVRELLQNAQSEIMRLSRMVGSMLTLASMSENTERRKLDFSSLLRSGVEMLSLNLEKRGNAIRTEIEPELLVFGNADLLAQALSNLLQNAGAHTENGEVAVRAAREDGQITVEVRDTGAGISPELLPRVFERGVSEGGTGLGLYLCRAVVESHGGRIWIDSEPGGGTTVCYALPVYEGQLYQEEAGA